MYVLFFYPGFQIENIIISENIRVKNQDLENLVDDNININIFSIGNFKLATKSIFLVNSGKLSEKILNQFPAVEKIKATKIFPETLSLEVVERIPVAAYCSGADSEQECFLIDKDGIIFEQLYGVPENLIIMRQLQGPSHVSVGNQVIAKNIIDSISSIEKTLKENFQIDLKDALLTSPLRLNIKTSEGWEAYFNLDSDSNINLQLVKLNLLLDGEISPEDRVNLEYIDLRFKDRAFYK